MAWVRERSTPITPPAKPPSRPSWRMRATVVSGIFGLGLMTGWFLAFHLFTALLIPLLLGATAGALLMARTGKKRRP